MGKARRHYTRELKKAYLTAAPKEINVLGSGQTILLRPQECLTFEYPKVHEVVLPETWEAHFTEEISWPPPSREAQQESPPFRLFLRINRAGYRLRLPIHDKRDPWLGPTFKSTLRRFRFPTPPTFPFRTYLVYEDDLKDSDLGRWIALVLAQRTLLTPEEEDHAVEEFFAQGPKATKTARLDAYSRLKARYVQPIGPNPTFPSLFGVTVKWRKRDEEILFRREREWEPAAAIDGDEGSDAIQDLEGHSDFPTLEKARGRRDMPLAGPRIEYGISLRETRRREPQLYRALLDRIRRGKIKTMKREDGLYVATTDADAVEVERLQNAQDRQPKRFPGRRTRWIDQLVAFGLKQRSAERKIKRWINDLKLSEAEIEASVAKRRLVRLPSSRQPL